VRLLGQGDEKLAAAGVLAVVGDSHGGSFVACPTPFTADGEAGASPTVPAGVAALDHEIRDDAVIVEVLEETLADQIEKNGAGVGGDISVERDDEFTPGRKAPDFGSFKWPRDRWLPSIPNDRGQSSLEAGLGGDEILRQQCRGDRSLTSFQPDADVGRIK